MKKLYRIHFIAIAVIDLLLFAFFITRLETSFEWLLLSGLIFFLDQGLLLFLLVVRLKHQFAEIYPQINNCNCYKMDSIEFFHDKTFLFYLTSFYSKRMGVTTKMIKIAEGRFS
ncbi:Uncharacterised protein [Streptococcus pneumoniae]|nr:Uncharacterised protein [Streptococcus pneumoniae]